MRGGGGNTSSCSVLTSEAASVLKQSLGLARRRGHGQVTPLHVAFTLLSSTRATTSSDLLRKACLKSHPPHPLQCRALELCFNVALNRLPTLTTTTSPLLTTPNNFLQQPSLSNALVAALKRAQAHQRRGSIEQQHQNQPLLPPKVELEQLVVSILDDPSVSRVMREAGFSSPSVKSHIQESILSNNSSSSSSSVFQYHHNSITGIGAGRGRGGGVYTSPPSPTSSSSSKDQLNNNKNWFWPTSQYFFNHSSSSLSSSSSSLISNNKIKIEEDDVKLVLEAMRRRSNTVIVGDSGETLVWELRDRVERGDCRLPSHLRTARFIRMSFDETALKEETNYVKELRKTISTSSCCCILYVGDLKWTISDAADYLVKEIASLVVHINKDDDVASRGVWVVATASVETYIKCRQMRPHLHLQWGGLQTLSLPSATALSLTLHPPSSLNEQITPLLKSPSKLNCCGECSSNYEKEAGLCKSSQNKLLPSWLHPQFGSHQQDELVELRRKWNSVCQSLHRGKTRETATVPLMYSPQKQRWVDQNKSLLFPNDANSISFAVPVVSKSVPRFRRQNSCSMMEYKSSSLNLSSLMNTDQDKELKITLALGSSVTAAAEQEKSKNTGDEMSSWQRGNMYSRVLKEYIPWQSENIPGIVQVMCNKGDIWFLVQGNDQIGKIRMASGIALGDSSSLVHLKMMGREDDEMLLQLTGALDQPAASVVLLVEDFDLGDTRFVKLLTDRFEKGSAKPNRVVFVLTMSGNDVVKPATTTIPMVLKVYKKAGSPYNMNKRKEAKEEEEEEEDFLMMSRIQKKPRITTINNYHRMEGDFFSRQSSFNSLDLNIRADDELNDASPVSSDLTREMNTSGMMMNEVIISPCNHLVRSINNKFFFNRSPARDREMKEAIGLKIKASFDEVYGRGGGGGAHNNKVVTLGIEDRVLEMVLLGGGDSFVNNVFERWVKEIFKTSLEITGKQINMEGGNGISFMLCVNVGGTNDNLEGEGGKSGFLGTNLPNKILVISEEEHI